MDEQEEPECRITNLTRFINSLYELEGFAFINNLIHSTL